MAAEYGVIGEISRGSSTAANARKRCLSSRRPPHSLTLSLSHSPSLPRPILCHSTLADVTVLSFLPVLHVSLSFFLSIVSVSLNICKRIYI